MSDLFSCTGNITSGSRCCRRSRTRFRYLISNVEYNTFAASSCDVVKAVCVCECGLRESSPSPMVTVCESSKAVAQRKAITPALPIKTRQSRVVAAPGSLSLSVSAGGNDLNSRRVRWVHLPDPRLPPRPPPMGDAHDEGSCRLLISLIVGFITLQLEHFSLCEAECWSRVLCLHFYLIQVFRNIILSYFNFKIKCIFCLLSGSGETAGSRSPFCSETFSTSRHKNSWYLDLVSLPHITIVTNPSVESLKKGNIISEITVWLMCMLVQHGLICLTNCSISARIVTRTSTRQPLHQRETLHNAHCEKCGGYETGRRSSSNGRLHPPRPPPPSTLHPV